MSCCYGCTIHTATCHADCKEYADERAEKAAERARRREAAIGGREVGEYKYGMKTRAIRRIHGERRK